MHTIKQFKKVVSQWYTPPEVDVLAKRVEALEFVQQEFLHHFLARLAIRKNHVSDLYTYEHKDLIAWNGNQHGERILSILTNIENELILLDHELHKVLQEKITAKGDFLRKSLAVMNDYIESQKRFVDERLPEVQAIKDELAEMLKDDFTSNTGITIDEKPEKRKKAF